MRFNPLIVGAAAARLDGSAFDMEATVEVSIPSSSGLPLQATPQGATNAIHEHAVSIPSSSGLPLQGLTPYARAEFDAITAFQSPHRRGCRCKETPPARKPVW